MTSTISDPTLFVRDYNIRPRQCQTPRFSRETTISGPEHDTYNLRPHSIRVVWDVTDSPKTCRASEGREKAVRWRSIPTTETQDTQVTVHSLVRVGTAIIGIPSRVIRNN